MKNLALPSELMAFINESGKFVFIDDFSGWGEEAQLKNFRFGPAMEGNKLIADTGKEFGFQYVSMRRGNHLTVQLRDHREKKLSTAQIGRPADFPRVRRRYLDQRRVASGFCSRLRKQIRTGRFSAKSGRLRRSG